MARKRKKKRPKYPCEYQVWGRTRGGYKRLARIPTLKRAKAFARRQKQQTRIDQVCEQGKRRFDRAVATCARGRCVMFAKHRSSRLNEDVRRQWSGKR